MTETEQMIQEKGLTAPRITPQDIEALLDCCDFRVAHEAGTTSTFVHVYLNGTFYLGTGHSACVSPENFDAEIGSKIAHANAYKIAQEKLWELEGYRLYREVNQ